MPAFDQERATVVVTGDVTIDWNIACAVPDSHGTQEWIEERGNTRAYWQRGGAALMADLVDGIARGLATTGGPTYTVRQTAAPKAKVAPEDPRFHHTYKQWLTFPHSKKNAGSLAWRLAEWLGMSRTTAVQQYEWAQVVDDTPAPTLIVLGDATLGFRDEPALWPQALQPAVQSGATSPWVLLKMSRPVAQGALWEHLHSYFADRLIVVTTIDDLRQTEVQISRELSWERTAQDLAWELVYNPHINLLSRCAHVVVSFGAAGAMLMSRRDAADAGTQPSLVESRLFFDPKVIEGMWENEYPGQMSGYTSCITAALAHQLMVNRDEPDIDQAVQSGLASLRRLHREGFGKHGPGSDSPVIFPIERIVDELFAHSSDFSVAPVRDPARSILSTTENASSAADGRLWTILEDRHQGGLDRLAQQIVLQGVERALQDVPLGQFGALLTVDRQEIESYRSLRTLVGEYCRQANPSRPLSLAVFGAPGSGKSFGVTQVASSLLPGQIEKLTFNLSQFDTSHQLLDAFHQVRDTALEGRIPLVFWDEFDTALDDQPLGWLRHFLAPMQDGVFQEGQILHPIGRAIFVFAGGTSESMASFDRGQESAFRAAKGPDFVSRLKGFVNVAGPNPVGGDSDADRYFIVRRAILLRFLLQSHAPQIFRRREDVNTPQIDSGVLRAFLEIPRYKHGARSLESIVSISTLTGKSHFERSSLPTEAQLNIHVDGRQFLSLVQHLELDGAVLERLAEAAHEIYRASVLSQGRRAEENFPLYADLPEPVKEQNRQAVRDIPAKLAYAGYVMRPARSDEPAFDFPDGDREALAEREHERWLKAHLAAGWRYGPQTDVTAKIHAVLLPWRIGAQQELAQRYSADELASMGEFELPDEEKEKNRELIDGIPRILARAGYTLIKVRETPGGFPRG